MYWAYRKLFRRQFFLSFWSSLQDQLPMPLSYFVVVLAVHGEGGTLNGSPVTIALASQVTMVTGQLIAALSGIPDLYNIAGTVSG